MVYIYKKKVGNKEYYYLRASKREGKKVVVKDIAYLGDNLKKVEENLDNLSSHEKEIRKAYHTLKVFLDSNYHLEKAKKKKLKKDEFLGKKQLELEACKIHFFDSFLKLDELTKREILNNFLIEFAFNTTSIEGNTITLKEAKNLLEEGKTPKDKTLREIYDLQNTKRVFFELYDKKFKEELSLNFIIKIHDSLLENIDKRKGLRNMEIKVFKSNFDASPVQYLKTDMELLLKWYKENKSKLDPLVLATLFHHKFEKIHPFADGNGRTGRMIMNYILMKDKHPPIIIQKKFREDYLDTMQTADKSDLSSTNVKEYRELVEFCVNEIISNYWNLFLF
ncbi:Fic family protein [Patescibacteria group bacterium]|nr:Fic family protein [Patescibacteria group bacterium]